MKHLVPIALLATALAGGYGAEHDAVKEAPIDWRARAAMVKVGMTRAEVEKILPMFPQPDSKYPFPLCRAYTESYGGGVIFTSYLVSEDWEVTICYDYSGPADAKSLFHPESKVTVAGDAEWPPRHSSVFHPESKVTAAVKIRKVKKPVLAARAAAKEAPIDWPARAATVKVGMTRAEVEKILPRWYPPPYINTFNTFRGDGGATVTGGGYYRFERYLVAEDWRVIACYDFARDNKSNNSADRIRTKPWTIDQRVGLPANDASWSNPYNRLLEPVRINKIVRSAEEEKEWMAKAASIKVGVTRAVAEQNIPAWKWDERDSPGSGLGSHEIYKFSHDGTVTGSANITWSLTIDYDGHGGDRSLENRVVAPVKIETFEKPVPPKPTP